MSEAILHQQIIDYVKAQYPDVLVNTDLSGIKLTPGQANKVSNLRTGRAWPDIFFPEPRGIFKGLFIELKIESPYKKDGSLKKQIQRKKLRNGVVIEYDHLKEQYEMLIKLEDKGYYAEFGVGFYDTKDIIDWYFNQ